MTFSREPAVWTGVIAAVALLLGYEIDTVSVERWVTIAVPIVVGLVTRYFVTPAPRRATPAQ